MSGVIVIKDGVELPVRLKKGGDTFTIAPAAEVKAALTSIDKATVYIPAVLQSNAAAGADWANSLVVIEFSELETDISEAYMGDATLEIQVFDGVKKTWFIHVEITKGVIA